MNGFLGLTTWFLLFPAAPTGQDVVLAPEKQIRSPGNAELSFDLAETPPGQQVRLSLDARIDWPAVAGSNPFMIVYVNARDLRSPDLINKPVEFTMRCGMDTTWVYGSTWRICYSPDFSDVLRTVPMPLGIADCDPYRFVWDVTPYVKPGKNLLRFVHPHVLASGTTLVLRDIRVEVGAPLKSAAIASVQPAPEGALPVYVPRGPSRVPMEVQLGSGGSIRLNVAGRSFELTSRTSQPEGKWISTTGGNWLSLTRGSPAEACWSGAGYRVRRQVTLRDDHLHVADAIENTGSSLVGVIYENRLAVDDKPKEILLGGRPVFSENQESREACHPSAMVQWDGLTLGMVAEDDVFRVHVRSFREPRAIGLADPQLGIAPGKSHTLEWSVYPAPGGDYWDFINAVRRNWGSNITIPGPAMFDHAADGTKSQKELADWARRRSARIVISGQTVFQGDEVAEGTAIPMATKWCASAKDWARKLHDGDPNLRVLIYLHSQICTEPGAEKLYPDSKLLDQNGGWVTSPYRYPVYVYLSTLENSYGRALLKSVQKTVEDLGADGFYLDEMEWASAPYAYRGPWDGCSVTIDPRTHAVGGKFASVALLEQSWKAALVKWLRETGRMIMGNSQPSTRTMLRLEVPRFVEMASYSFLIETHFGCPWALANHDAEDSDAARARMARRMLDHGGVICIYGWGGEPQGRHFTDFAFPITPLELRAGMVIGRERILCNRSGLYGWPDGSAAEVHVFDAEGREVANPRARPVREGGRLLTELRMPSDHIAVLVKSP